MEPFSKTIIATLSITALMGALMKVASKRIENTRELAWSLFASICAAYVAFIAGEALQLSLTHMHMIIWVGAYLGREFGELVAEAVKIAIRNGMKK